MKLNFLFIAFIAILFSSCKKNNLVQLKDIETWLQSSHINEALTKITDDEKFWQQRLAADSNNYINYLGVSKAYLSRFKLLSNINDLNKGEELLRKAAARLDYKHPDLLQTLSRVAITGHRFKEAAMLNSQSLEFNGNEYAYSLAAFDASMELGLYKQSSRFLEQNGEKESFHYLIRLAKKQDHDGNLDAAIQSMEKAFDKIKHTNNTELYCWTLANLGDMYGHAGRIKESYNMYRKVLDTDPAYLYALKGIAWIAYAHDRNTPLAKTILNFINQHAGDPTTLLLLAELATYEGNANEAGMLKARFIREAGKASYGTMHNKYLIQLFTEDEDMLPAALKIAQQELKDRETPETWSWLAWVYYHMGDYEKAGNIYSNYVLGKTFEPEALVYGVFILDKMNRENEAQDLYNECMESAFELGPVQIAELKMHKNQ